MLHSLCLKFGQKFLGGFPMKKILVLLLSVILLSACTEETVTPPEPPDSDAIILNLDEVARGSIDSEDEVNLYTFETGEAGVVTINLSPLPENLNASITIYEADKTTKIDDDDVYGARGQATEFLLLLAPATYYIEIARISGEVSDEEYELRASLDASDENELNNTPDTATPLTLGEEASGDIYVRSDKDYYKVTTEETGVLEILLSSISVGSNLRLSLLDENKKEIENDVAPSGDSASFKHLAAAGTFYIEVSFSFGEGTTDAYQILASLNTEDVNELNEGFATATPLNLGEIIKGAIYGDEDVDYFSATVSAGSYKLLLAGIPQNTNYYITVFGENKARLPGTKRTFVPTGSSFELDLSPEAETTYYALIESGSAVRTTDMYELSVTPTP